jgi:hypothetical protein
MSDLCEEDECVGGALGIDGPTTHVVTELELHTTKSTSKERET